MNKPLVDPWREISAAHMPAAHLDALAPLRDRPEVRINIQGDRAWVCWSGENTPLLRLLLLVPGVHFLANRAGDKDERALRAYLAAQCQGRHAVERRQGVVGQDHVRPSVGRQFFDRRGQRVEIAAEARAGHLAHVEPLRPQAVCIDQVGRLIVGDDGGLQALLPIPFGQSGDRRSLARAQETAEHNETGGWHDGRSK